MKKMQRFRETRLWRGSDEAYSSIFKHKIMNPLVTRVE